MFDTQNPIIGMLLTQIQSGKTKIEKAIENQLKAALSIKDLQIAERLKHLKQHSKGNYNDDNDDDDDDDDTAPPPAPPSACIFDPLPHCLPLPFFDSDDDSDIEGENPIQKFLLPAVTAREKTAIKKVIFSEFLRKLFPETDEIFDNQKIDDKLTEITIPNTQTNFKELNNRKILKKRQG